MSSSSSSRNRVSTTSSLSITNDKTRSSHNKTPSKIRPSIFLIDGNHNGKKIRHDFYGNEIVKGNKNCKISFIDTVTSCKLAEVIIVDNQNGNVKTTCECNSSCVIC